jgi:hypothetical protein
MSKWVFFGHVLPERATLTWQTPLKGHSHDPYNDIEYDFRVVIHSNQAIVDIEPTKGDPDMYDLRYAAAACIRIITDLVGYQCGHSYDVEVVSAVCEEKGVRWVFGIDIPILVERRGFSQDGSIEGALVAAVARSPAAQMALADFREAMLIPNGTGFFCYRAIEAVMQSMKASPDDDDKLGWDALRQRLCADRSALTEVQNHAAFPRHGKQHGMTSAERNKVFALTDEVIRRYLGYLTRGEAPLGQQEFPMLKFP